MSLSAQSIAVMVVDDHPVVRTGLRAISEIDPGIMVVAEAATIAEARARLADLKPRMLLLDIRLPDGSGIDFCNEIKNSPGAPFVIFLTSFADDELILSAMQAGADGYLLKGNDQTRIAEAIRAVSRGGVMFDPAMARDAARKSRATTGLHKLTPQELRVLQEVALGKTDKQVALDLALSPKTVRNYLDHVFEKLGVSTRTEAAVIWLKQTPKSEIPPRV
jgi:two-component system, NarL family, response regulator DevR